MKKPYEIERLEKWDVFEDKEERVTLDELAYYCFNCDSRRFRKDMFHDKNFVQEYMAEKFIQFRDDFKQFMWSMDGANRQRLAKAIKKFYKEKNNEK